MAFPRDHTFERAILRANLREQAAADKLAQATGGAPSRRFPYTHHRISARGRASVAACELGTREAR